ncbi:hypothetical protein H920_12774 [Fukomys damarensis]|uniref:Uncharacterized protein n=1 Tax=Fukomys damarensis TaxID=885580 RepID=A0A091DST7_FUKDA|nr:hypothetical protein H920_12774 [Fukomys damarensis]
MTAQTPDLVVNLMGLVNSPTNMSREPAVHFCDLCHRRRCGSQSTLTQSPPFFNTSVIGNAAIYCMNGQEERIITVTAAEKLAEQLALGHGRRRWQLTCTRARTRTRGRCALQAGPSRGREHARRCPPGSCALQGQQLQKTEGSLPLTAGAASERSSAIQTAVPEPEEKQQRGADVTGKIRTARSQSDAAVRGFRELNPPDFITSPQGQKSPWTLGRGGR